MRHIQAMEPGEIFFCDGRTVVAWLVRGEDGDEVVTWGTACLMQAKDSGRRLVLLEPIFARDTGTWSYEEFKRAGCQHCKEWTRYAAPVQLVEDERGNYTIQDSRGKLLVGLRNVDTTQIPAGVIPQNWDLLSEPVAILIKEAIQSGIASPIFRSR